MHPLNQLHDRIILASASPRRAELLRQVGLCFDIFPSDINECAFQQAPPERVRRVAAAKARAVTAQAERGVIIGADTVVVQGHHVLGKPADANDAHGMLRLLSAKTHQVLTGVALLDVETDEVFEWVSCTTVHFRFLTEDEIDWYVGTGEPMDKAGAYGIQGRAAAFVLRIEGCYTNVVGLPVGELIQHLMAFPARNQCRSY